MALDESSQPIDLLLAVARGGGLRLGTQIEDQLRSAIRDGSLKPDARVPSTRDLARQLGVSRRVVVDAYAQLAAEGYLSLRQGARPRVSAAPVTTQHTSTAPARPAPPPRFDLRPSLPDVSMFPRAAWLRSVREALGSMADGDLGYGDPRGVETLRTALADYLGRVRGVVTDPEHILITNGYTQGLSLVCRALAVRGAKRIALEDPSNPEDQLVATRAGLGAIPIAVDAHGLCVEELERADVDLVTLTPAHQHPTGVVLAGERRTALLSWLRRRDTIAVEDDYDAEYRYDRTAVGALQGLDPERIVYAGSMSKTLAPALRIGWLALPPALLDAVCHEKRLADRGSARIDQHALADFLVRGELDRHIRRMRTHYRRRRDALVEALTRALPEATIGGVAAGLHVTVSLREDDDEHAICAEAEQRRIALETMSEFQTTARARAPTLLLGYGQLPEAAVPAAVGELVRTVRAARDR